MTRREFIATWFGAAWGFAVGTILGRSGQQPESGYGPPDDAHFPVPVTPVPRREPIQLVAKELSFRVSPEVARLFPRIDGRYL